MDLTDYERTVLEHYQLSTPFPLEWPSEKDLSDVSDDEENEKKPTRKSTVRKSRFSVLERAASSRKSYVPGAQKTGDGVENLVQKDEPDPLGSTASVVRMLRESGLPVSEDATLRNRFLLSSTTFSPALFLAQVHSGASTTDLLMGRDVLSQSIDQKSASLKVLVESEFERFVRATSVIDSVYNEMKNQGVDPNQTKPRPHSRHTSRTSINLRGSSNGASGMLSGPPSPTSNKKKNALLKESEYGVLGIKAPLIDVSAKAEEVWGPALGGREKEEKMKSMVSSFERCKENYELAASISESIKRRDYESLVEEYARAKRFSDEAKSLADTILSSRTSATDAQIYQILGASRMWYDVEEIVGAFKRDVQKRLVLTQGSPKGTIGGTDPHIELISILLELGVEENPIWTWLLSRYEGLKSKIEAASDRTRVEIEIMRRKLANTDKPTAQAVRAHLRSVGRQGLQNKTATLDSADIIELWEKMVAYLTGILSSQGLLGEVVEFWQTTQGFIEGKTQKTLPVGLDGSSRKHHKLSDEGMLDLQNGTVELVDMIRDTVYSFFADPPLEDISALFSPVPSTPKSPPSATTPGLTPTGLRAPRLNYDAANLPPPSPRRGEAWEKFAFWPPWSNSLSAVHYLAKLLVLVGSGASEMVAIGPVVQDSAVLELLRALVGTARERCVTAVCAAWNKDAENIKVLEDWKRSHEKRDITKMPASFEAFENTLLLGMQKILYVSEALVQPGSAEVVFPPPAKLLQIVRNQFVTTLYKALAGMVENAEKSIVTIEDDWSSDLNGLASPVVTMAAATNIGAGTVNASDRNVRMLLTLSNLQALRLNIVPSLTTQFENAFSVKLTEETKTIRDVLGQIDARLFQSYTRPAVETIHSIIQTGILAPDWEPAAGIKPSEVKPYVYETLLSLVLIHSQVSTTASSLTGQVLSYLLEQTCRELLAAFSQRTKYTLSSLMQATLDIEFIAQILGFYTTDRASEIQSEIYQQLDKGTDNKAREELQGELPGMRGVLKVLREGSKSEFACFRKPKRPVQDRDRSGTGTSMT